MAELDDKYRGRIVCMGDFNSLAEIRCRSNMLRTIVLTDTHDFEGGGAPLPCQNFLKHSLDYD